MLKMSQTPDMAVEVEGGTRTHGALAVKRHRRYLLVFASLAAVILIAVAAAVWLAGRATAIESELQKAGSLIEPLKSKLSSNDPVAVSAIVEEIRLHTNAAKDLANDPIWTLSSNLPFIGANFGAVAEVSRSADDVAGLGLEPLAETFRTLDWESLLPASSDPNLVPLKTASPKVAAAAEVVHLSAERLSRIDSSTLLPQVAQPLDRARDQLQEATGALDKAANVAKLAPDMLGADGRRNYLMMIQNNAESRASGGIPGALAIVTLDKGKMSIGLQTSATSLGTMSPTLSVDPQQQQIYSGRLGKYMQDVNLTPDFPTAAASAQAIWEKKTGEHVDGVVSIDPVVLSYILQATGPVEITGPGVASVKAVGMTTELTGENVVPTLLSDVYAKIQQPKLQDTFFAGVAKEVFAALSSGKGEAKGLISGLTRGTEEGRVLVWSANTSEQAVISNYPLSGSIAGPSVSPAQFGVYFNDGTGAKMDYYVKRTVKLIKECPADGYEQTRVRITSTNTAPRDAAMSLPEYVTGGGVFGVPPGSVQTNIVTYGPAQANVESASEGGKKIPLAPYLHGNRPVGVVSQQLAPGESKTVEFTFAKIVQHVEPNIVVTPTVQPVKEVILPTENASCG